ncbi:MAG: 5'/3'-nucleotidase SurE [Thermofilaceae archaeon]
MRIVVTNDDGLRSPGLRLLYEAVRELGEAIIVAPLEQASARGGMLTLDEPIRVYEVDLGYAKAFGITGSPRDVVHVAREVFGGADLLVSGVNVGENTSVQNILVSGTVGAAFEAALFGIAGIAYSADVEKAETFLDTGYAEFVKTVCGEIARYVVERGMPKGVDVLNVNLPRRPSRIVKVAPPARLRWIERLDKRLDPRGKPYYWLYGEAAQPEPGTDSYVVFVEGGISITPLALSLRGVDASLLDELIQALRSAIEKSLKP